MSEVLDDIVKSGYCINPIMLYELTPVELHVMIAGEVEKRKQEDKAKNIRAGIIAAAIYEVNRNPKKRKKPYTWEDFFPEKPQPKPKQTPEQIKSICKSICKTLGGKINGT